MHVTAARKENQKHTSRCDQEIDMRLQQRDVEISWRYRETKKPVCDYWKHQESDEGLEMSVKSTMMGGVRYPGVGNVLLGSGERSYVVRLFIVSRVRGNNADI